MLTYEFEKRVMSVLGLIWKPFGVKGKIDFSLYELDVMFYSIEDFDDLDKACNPQIKDVYDDFNQGFADFDAKMRYLATQERLIINKLDLHRYLYIEQRAYKGFISTNLLKKYDRHIEDFAEDPNIPVYIRTDNQEYYPTLYELHEIGLNQLHRFKLSPEELRINFKY